AVSPTAALIHVAGDHDRQPQIADGLLQPLAADGLRHDPQRGKRRTPRHEDRLAEFALRGTERQLGLVGIVGRVRVDRPGPLLRLVGLQRPRCLVAPRLLTIELARLPGAGARRLRGGAAVKGTPIRDAAGHEWFVTGPVREVLTGHHVRRCAREWPGVLAPRSASGLAPPTRRPRPGAGPKTGE